MIHNVRSAHNVGSLFRTSDGAGVSKIFLTGYTPSPYDRFGRPVKELHKTALGSVAMVPHEYSEDGMACLKKLRAEGMRIIVLEQHRDAVDYRSYIPACDERMVLVVGNEIDGVPEEMCIFGDTILHIPLLGKKASLNVGVAGGVALFNMRARQRHDHVRQVVE